ncbi:MAG: RluA family pseudouridine synthase [Nitriliruptoraceae bacterium]
MNRLEVPAAADGQRLDVWLAGHLEISRSQAAARIDAGQIVLGGVQAPRGRRLRAGEVVEVATPTPTPTSPPPPLPPIRYRDEHLLVVAKPAGLVVHPGPGHPDDTLVEALEAAGIPLAPGTEGHRPGIVHRLDRGTSGLLLVASTQEAFIGLTAALAARRVSRRYLAVVAGVPEQPRGRIEAPIGRDPLERTRFAVVAGGRHATTHYRVLASASVPGMDPRRGAVTSLVCRLGTGRTHQLRVHLAALGTPILGDAVYGAPAAVSRAAGLERPFLHAAAIGLDHPITGARLELCEPLPDELRSALERTGLPLPEVAEFVGEGSDGDGPAS